MVTIRHEAGDGGVQVEESISGGALARQVPEVVAEMPFGLSLSMVQRTAAVHRHLGPLSDAEERLVRRLLTRGVPVADPDGRFPLIRGRWPGLVDWGQLWDLEGGPIVMGDAVRWAGRDVSEVVAFLRPLLAHGTPEERRALLEDQLADGLRGLGFVVERGRRTRASDLWVRVNGLWINVECRNRVWAVLDQLESRDREIFPVLAAEGHPSIMVTGEVTHRLRQEMATWGGVAEIGCCVVRSGDDVERLSGWSAGRSLVTRLSDVAVSAVADELERLAAGLRGVHSPQDRSNVVELASRVSWSEAARLVAPGLQGEAVVLPWPGRPVAGRVQVSDEGLRAEAEAYLADHPGAVQLEVAGALGVSVRTLGPATSGLWRRGRPSGH